MPIAVGLVPIFVSLGLLLGGGGGSVAVKVWWDYKHNLNDDGRQLMKDGAQARAIGSEQANWYSYDKRTEFVNRGLAEIKADVIARFGNILSDTELSNQIRIAQVNFMAQATDLWRYHYYRTRSEEYARHEQRASQYELEGKFELARQERQNWSWLGTQPFTWTDPTTAFDKNSDVTYIEQQEQNGEMTRLSTGESWQDGHVYYENGVPIGIEIITKDSQIVRRYFE